MPAASTTLRPHRILVPPGAGGAEDACGGAIPEQPSQTATQAPTPDAAPPIGRHRFLSEIASAALRTHPHIPPASATGPGIRQKWNSKRDRRTSVENRAALDHRAGGRYLRH